jgi:xanthine dehydrogenase accessory factor
MFEIADRLLAAADAGRRIAVATAISIEGSAPRTVGTSMALARSGDGTDSVLGTIAGGCVEGALVGVCEEVLDDGEPRTVQYGVSDDDAFAVGLTCGGDIRVHVQLLDERLLTSLRSGTSVEVCAEFTEQAAAPEHMIILGSMDFSAALARAASMTGFRVTVVDARPLFATAERFPTAEVVVEWPTEYLARTELDENTVVCVLSHDWRFDAESLAIALRSPARFVGAMGSRSTHDRRIASLNELGVDTARLRSPIGLSIGASTPEETAISILGEVIASRTGSSVAALAATSGPIHVRA